MDESEEMTTFPDSNSDGLIFPNLEGSTFSESEHLLLQDSDSEELEEYLNPSRGVEVPTPVQEYEIEMFESPDSGNGDGNGDGDAGVGSVSYVDFMLGRPRDYRVLLDDINVINRVFVAVFLGLEIGLLIGLNLQSDGSCGLQLDVMAFWDTVAVGANLFGLLVLQRYLVLQSHNGIRIWLLLCRMGTWGCIGLIIYQMVRIYRPPVDPTCYRLTLFPCLIGLYVAVLIFAGFLILSYAVSLCFYITHSRSNYLLLTPPLPPPPNLELYTTLYTLATLPDQYKQDFCTICLDDFNDPTHTSPISSNPIFPSQSPIFRQIDICKHIYHRKCIDEWLIQNNRHCPLCRSSLREQMELEETVELHPPPTDTLLANDEPNPNPSF